MVPDDTLTFPVPLSMAADDTFPMAPDDTFPVPLSKAPDDTYISCAPEHGS